MKVETDNLNLVQQLRKFWVTLSWRVMPRQSLQNLIIFVIIGRDLLLVDTAEDPLFERDVFRLFQPNFDLFHAVLFLPQHCEYQLEPCRDSQHIVLNPLFPSDALREC